MTARLRFAAGLVFALGVASCGGRVPSPVVLQMTTPEATTQAVDEAATPTTDEAANGGRCSLFPADNIWNTPIDDAPVDPLSDQYIQAIGADESLHPDFGSGLWEGAPIGIPYIEVSAETTRHLVNFYYPEESDPGPYPIPPNPLIEGGAESDGDRHILMLEADECRLYELYDARLSDGSWGAGSGAVFDLRSNDLRPAGWTSADAAGLPILPGLVRFDEVVSGEIRHALRFTAPRTQRAFIWPARHFASDDADPALPPMGLRFRLRADFDLGPFPPQVRVILRALQVYGMMVADNGSPWFLSGTPDERWDNDVLHALGQVHGRDFEAVDVSGMMVDPDSGEAQ